MANKKPKGGKSKGGKGSQGPKGPSGKRPNQQNDLSKDMQFSPQDRVDAVRPMWETLPQDERVQMLTVDIPTLREKAKQMTASLKQQQQAEIDALGLAMVLIDPALEELLDEGILRLREKSTWKLWTWPPDDSEFFDADTFRTHITEKHIREDLVKLLPRDDPKGAEKPAEAAFRTRMQNMLTRVQQHNNRLLEEGSGNSNSNSNGSANPKDGKKSDSNGKSPEPTGSFSRMHRRRRGAPDQIQVARDLNIELLNIMVEALEKEHEHLYQLLIFPIAAYVDEAVQSGRDASKSDLAFEDLERLLPEDTTQIVEWLTEKVDSLSARLKVEVKEDEEPEDEENMGDVDLWALDEPGDLAVNEKWLQHLQDRLLGEDGHPRKAKSGEDPHHTGLVLEWVYGSIVSTAEKTRDGAKRYLGSYVPRAQDAHNVLVRALEDQLQWETRGKQAKDLMSEILKHRLEAQELSKLYNIKADKPPDLASSSLTPVTSIAEEDALLPDHVVVFMLRREVLLTHAKLHHLFFEHLQQERSLKSYKAQLRQGEPEFERLKRELEDVKHAHRGGLDGAYRTAAEMERHRAQLADAAIEEQLEVQTAFREQGARLQAIYEKKQRAEYEMAKREPQISKLQQWKNTVESLVDKLVELTELAKEGADLAAKASLKPDVAASEAGGAKVGAGTGGDAPNGPAGAEGTGLTTGGDAAPSGEAGRVKDIEEGGGAGPMAIDWTAPGAAAASGREDWEVNEPGGIIVGLNRAQHLQLAKLRTHFHKDIRNQLYGEADDKQFFEWLNQEAKAVEKRLEENRVVLQHLEVNLVNTACDDPGASIGTQLALPIIMERLDAKALESAAERAKMAETEIIRMEMEQQEREAAERERRFRAKLSKKEKARSEKEKLQAEKSAKEEAEKQRIHEEEMKRKEQEEEDRKLRLQKIEELRKQEEEEMEQRRQELLSDENGYWRQRMQMDRRQQQQQQGEEEEGSEAKTDTKLSTSTSSSLRALSEGDQATNRSTGELSATLSDNCASGSDAAAASERKPLSSQGAEVARLGNGVVENGARQRHQGNEGDQSRSSAPTANGAPGADSARRSRGWNGGQGGATSGAGKGAGASSSPDLRPRPPPVEQLRGTSAVAQPTEGARRSPHEQGPATAREGNVQAPASPAPPAPAPTHVNKLNDAAVLKSLPMVSPPVGAHARNATAAPNQATANGWPPVASAPARPPLQQADAEVNPALQQPNGNDVLPAAQQHIPVASPMPSPPQAHLPPISSNQVHPFMPPPPRGAGSHAMLPPPLPGGSGHALMHPTGPLAGPNILLPPPASGGALPSPQGFPPMQSHRTSGDQIPQPSHQPHVHPMYPGPPMQPVRIAHPVHFQQQPLMQGANLAPPSVSHPVHLHQQPPIHHALGLGPPHEPHPTQSPILHGQPRVGLHPPSPAAAKAMAVNSLHLPHQSPQQQQSGGPIGVASVGPMGGILPGMPLPLVTSATSPFASMSSPHASMSSPANGALHPRLPNGPQSPAGPPQVLVPMPPPPPGSYPTHMMAPSEPGGSHAMPVHVMHMPNGAGPNNMYLYPPHGRPMHGSGMIGPSVSSSHNLVPQHPHLHQQQQHMQHNGVMGMIHTGLHPQLMPMQTGHVHHQQGMLSPQGPPPPPPKGQSPSFNTSPRPSIKPVPLSLSIGAKAFVPSVAARPFVPCTAPSATSPKAPLPSSEGGSPEEGSAQQHLVTNQPASQHAAEHNSQASEPWSGDSTDPQASPAPPGDVAACCEAKPPPSQRSPSADAVQAVHEQMVVLPVVEHGIGSVPSTLPVEPSPTSEADSTTSLDGSSAASVAAAPAVLSFANPVQPESSATASAPSLTSSTTKSISPPASTSWSSVAAAKAPGVTSVSPVGVPRAYSGSSLTLAGAATPAYTPTAIPAASTAITATPTSAPTHPPTASNNNAVPAGSVSWKSRLQQSLAKEAASPSQAPLASQPPSAGAKGGPRGGPSPTTAGPDPQTDAPSQPPSTRRGSSRPNGPLPPPDALFNAGDGALGKLSPPSMVGRYSFTPPGADASSHELNLVRGLMNVQGSHNCFLNVIIQSLWHLPSFRQSLLQLAPEAVVLPSATPSQGDDKSDLGVMQALLNIFRKMSEEPGLSLESPSTSAVSPDELREALSSLQKGTAAINIDLSEMHDASEVLAEVFACLHRAQVGQPGDQAQDPQLPQRVRVRAPEARTHPTAASPAGSAGGGYAAALGIPTPASTATSVPCTIVHHLFGIQVQVPCPPGDNEEELPSPPETKHAARAGRSSASSSNPQLASQPQLATAQLAPSTSPASGSAKKLREQGLIEVQQYTKYLHLVPAQGLRSAYASLGPAASFEDILREVEVAVESASGGSSSLLEKGEPQVTLLRQPRVFTLAVVWESPQAPMDSIRRTLEALGPELDITSVFHASPDAHTAAGTAKLRSVVCYFGHHYLVMALSEELGLWLCYDDANISLVGRWVDVCRTMLLRRMQPSLLFYETEAK